MWTDPGSTVYKSLADTWFWKLGLRPCNYFSGNTLMGFLLQCRHNGEHLYNKRGNLKMLISFCRHVQIVWVIANICSTSSSNFAYWPSKSSKKSITPENGEAGARKKGGGEGTKRKKEKKEVEQGRKRWKEGGGGGRKRKEKRGGDGEKEEEDAEWWGKRGGCGMMRKKVEEDKEWWGRKEEEDVEWWGKKWRRIRNDGEKGGGGCGMMRKKVEEDKEWWGKRRRRMWNDEE